jgi:hypothetical protein
MYNFSILRDLKKMLLLINCCNKRGNHAISQNWRYFRSRKVFFFVLNTNNNLVSLNCSPHTDFLLLLLCWLWNTVDSRYLEFDWTMEKIRVNRSSTQEELWKYRKCSLLLLVFNTIFNNIYVISFCRWLDVSEGGNSKLLSCHKSLTKFIR